MAPALGLNPVIPAITSAHAQAATEGPVWRHALSVFGDVKYPADVKCEKSGEREVRFTFDSPGNRELPSIAGELPVLPKHWWEGNDSQGRKRDVTATTLEIPLGSGPYRIKEFVAARSVVLERVADYWGKDLPVSVGQNNFDQLRFEFFR